MYYTTYKISKMPGEATNHMETEKITLQVNEKGHVKLPESLMKKYNVSHDMVFRVSYNDDVIRGKIV